MNLKMERFQLIDELLNAYYPQLKIIGVSAMSKEENIFIVRTTEQAFFFKTNHAVLQENQKVLNQIYYLCSEYNLIPEIYPTKDNTYIQYHSGLLFSLQVYIKQDQRKEFNPILLGKKLARLHNVLASSKIQNRIVNHLDKTVDDMYSRLFDHNFETLAPIVQIIMDLKTKYHKQIIHGDLHANNILNYKDDYLFIDLDTAVYSESIQDVSFAAFRMLGMNEEATDIFIRHYNENQEKTPINKSDLVYFAIYNVLQRILYILIQNKAGNPRFMFDLQNQYAYLNRLLPMIGRPTLTFLTSK